MSGASARAADRSGAAGPSASQAPPIVDEVLGSPGQPLSPGARAFFEPRFRHDLSGVRVHTDARAAESARAVGARAYAVGSHVVFDRGEYAPAAGVGRRLLAHELAHTIQQRDADPAAPIRLDSSPRDEADAERAAEGLGRPGSIAVASRSPRSLARTPRSLSSSLLPAGLSDVELTTEINEIRTWLSAHPAAPEGQEMTAMLGRLGGELLRRHSVFEAMQRASVPTAGLSVARVAQAEATLAARAAAARALAGAAPEAAAATEAAAITTEAAAVATESVISADVAAAMAGANAAPAATAARVAAPRLLPAVGATASGVFAFLVVFFWPNDSIVSGADEKRMLDEALARQRQRQSQPRPQTSPAPETAPAPQAQPRPDVRTEPRSRRRRRRNAYPILWPVQLGPPSKTEFVKVASAPRDEEDAEQGRLRLLARGRRDSDFNPRDYHYHHVNPLFLGGEDSLERNGTVIYKGTHLRGHAILSHQPQMLTPPPGLSPLPANLYSRAHRTGTLYDLVGFKTRRDELPEAED